MKKKLSLLLSALLVMTLVPMSTFAALVIDLPGTIDVTTEQDKVNYSFVFGDKDTKIAKAGAFELSLNNGAVINQVTMTTGTGAATKKVVGQGSVVTLTDEFVATYNVSSNRNIICDIMVDFSKAEEGKSVNVKVSSIDGISGFTKKIANVVSIDAKSIGIEIKDDIKKVSEKGGNLTTFSLSKFENIKNDIVITLDNKAEFNYKNNARTAIIIDGVDRAVAGRKADTITLKYGTDFNSYTKLIEVRPYVNSINSEFGDVNVDITVKNQDENLYGKIGEVVEYGINITAVENGKKEIPTLLAGQKTAIKVTIEGTKGSITSGRNYQITLDGANTAKSGIVSQDGVASFDFVKTGASVSEFIVVPNNDTKMEFVTEVTVPADSENGIVTMSVSSKDLNEDTVIDIINVGKAISISTNETLIKVGEAVDSADVIITEAKAGQLKAGQYIYFVYNDKLALSEKPVISGSNGIKFDELNWIKNGNGDNVGVAAKILSNSTKASEITIKDLTAEMAANGINGRKYTASVLVGTDLKTSYNLVIGSSTVSKFAEFDYAQCISGDNQIIFTLNSATYTVGGTAKALEAPVFTKDNRTMLPIGPLALAMGLEVDYNAGAKEATFKDTIKGTTVTVKESASTLVINGSEKLMLTTATTVNGRIFVPVASITDAFGANIAWDADTKEVTIN